MRFEPLRYEHLRQMAEIEKEAFDMPWTESMFIPEVNSENATYIVGTRGGRGRGVTAAFTRCWTRRTSPTSR